MFILYKIKKGFLESSTTFVGVYILIALFIIIITSVIWFVYDVPYGEAVLPIAGHPPHNHIGWSAPGGGPLYGNCGSCTSSGPFIWHIQRELNFLDDLLPGFTINGGFLPENGAFGSDDNQAVRDYQWFSGILIDGIVGNETWAQMESDVFGVQSSYRMQAGLQLRFFIHNECRGYTNSAGGPDTFVPIRTSAEWNTFKANHPGNISSFAANCSISGGGGGGGGGGGSGFGGTNCARICSGSACAAAGCSPSSCATWGEPCVN